jgi:hypothetical protein
MRSVSNQYHISLRWQFRNASSQRYKHNYDILFNLRQERPGLIHRFEEGGGGQCECDAEICCGDWLLRRDVKDGRGSWHDENENEAYYIQY